MGKFEVSLAQNYVSDWTIVEAIREYFQNALDQEATEEDNKMFFEYDPLMSTLRIGNKKSVLTARTLLLGTTSKSDDNRTIGTHGEGYKVATLVALRAGKQVTFYNYGKREVWRPRMVKSRRYEGEEVLTFFTEKFVWTKTPNDNLTIEVVGITPEEYALIVESNLHLQNVDVTKHFKTSRGTILCDPKYSGKMYVNGLYIRTERDMEHGYNFLPKDIKLDRDRKMVSTFDLQWFTAKMWAEVNDAEVLEVVKKGTGDARYLTSQSLITVSPEVCKMALEDFREEHGDKAIPVCNQAQLEEVQNNYTDAKAVMVPEAQCNLIKKGPEYEVRAQKVAPMSLTEKMFVWFGKVQHKLTYEEQQEFLKLLGREGEEEEAPF